MVKRSGVVSEMDCSVPGGSAGGDFVVREFTGSEEVAQSPALGWLAALILQARQEGRLPRRQDIGPRRIGPQAMPGVIMVDVEQEPRRYRIRLVGTRLVKLSGKDRTGQYFDALAGELGDSHGFYMRLMDRLVTQRRPLLYTANLFHRGLPWVRYRCLVSPFSSDGEQVDLLVGAAEPLTPGH